MGNVDNDDLPGQPASGSVGLFYYRTKLLYILGFLQMAFGVAVIIIELAAIGIFYHETLSYPLEITGVFCGLLFIGAGYISFLAGRRSIHAIRRHRLFIAGTFLAFVALCAAVAMLVYGILRTEKKYEEAREKMLREDPQGKHYSTVPYAISAEGLRHTGHLRAVASVAYCVVALLVLPSMIIHAINIGKNKENLETGYNGDSSKNPFIFPLNKRSTHNM